MIVLRKTSYFKQIKSLNLLLKELERKSAFSFGSGVIIESGGGEGKEMW